MEANAKKKKRDGANVIADCDYDPASAASKKHMPAPPDQAHAGESTDVGVGEDILAWLTDLDVDSMAELMSLLQPEPSPPPSSSTAVSCSSFKVKFTDNPYSSPLILPSSSYITINGNEESCGSSFSDSESLMASVDTRGAFSGGAGIHHAQWGPSHEWAVRALEEEDQDRMLVDRCGEEVSWDDGMLARFLGEDLI